MKATTAPRETRRRGVPQSAPLSPVAPSTDVTAKAMLGPSSSPEWEAVSNGLVTIADVPPWLQFNSFIHTGYRPAPIRVGRALRSLLQLHNESFNVWSHLLPAAALLFWAARWAIVDEWVPSPASVLRTWPWLDWEGTIRAPLFQPGIIIASVVAMAFIFVSSSTYHLAMPCCSSAKGYQRLLCLDVVASLVSMATTAYSFIWYGDPCAPAATVHQWTMGFSIFAFTVFAVIVFVPMKVASRFLVFCVFCLVRLVVSVAVYGRQGSLTWLWFSGPPAFRHHATSFLVIFLGGLINVARIPERWFPPCPVTMRKLKRRGGDSDGTLTVSFARLRAIDVVGNSHNLWHLTCVASAALTLQGCFDDAEFYRYAAETSACL